MLDHKQFLYVLLIISGVVINLIAFFKWDPSFITNDGVQYLSTAENWLKGNGFSTNALMYSPHFQGEFPGPQTVWPPGYPLLLSLLSMLGIKLITAGLLLNLVSHAFASVLIVLILKRMRVETNYAIICALLFYMMAVPWCFARGLVSEPIFTCLILTAILYLPIPGRSRLSAWIICGFFVAACIYIRYSAVVYAAGVGFGIFTYLLLQYRNDWKALFYSCLRLAVLTAIPLAAFLQLMYRTNTLTGTVERNAGTRTPETLYFTIERWGSQASDLLGFTTGGIYSHVVGVILFLWTVAIVTFLVIYAVKKIRQDDDHDHNCKHAEYSRIAGLVVSAHALLMFLYLSYCLMTDSPLEILSRYLYQAYPGIYVLFCGLLYGLIRRTRNPATKRIPKPLRITLIMLVATYLISQVNEVTSTQNFYAEGEAAQVMLSLPVTENVTIGDYIDSCLQKFDQGSLWSTHGQHLHFNTKAPTLTLAEIYTNEPPNFLKLQQQMDTYNIKLMVFVTDEVRINSQYKQHMAEIKTWLSDNGHNLVALDNNAINSHITVDMYQVNQQCD